MTTMYMCAHIYIYICTARLQRLTVTGFSCVCKYTAITLIPDESLNQMRLRFRGTEDRLKMEKIQQKNYFNIG